MWMKTRLESTKIVSSTITVNKYCLSEWWGTGSADTLGTGTTTRG